MPSFRSVQHGCAGRGCYAAHGGCWLPLAVLVVGLSVLLSAFHAFDRSVTIQRDKYPEAWDADGRPHPFNPFSRGWSRSVRSGWAMQRCSMAWTFRAPDWARADAEAARWLERMRRSTVIWILVVMPLYAAALAFAVSRDSR